MAICWLPTSDAGMLKVALKAPPVPELRVATAIPPIPRVPYAPMRTVKSVFAGKFAVTTVTDVSGTTAEMEKVGMVYAWLVMVAGKSARAAITTTETIRTAQ